MTTHDSKRKYKDSEVETLTKKLCNVKVEEIKEDENARLESIIIQLRKELAASEEKHKNKLKEYKRTIEQLKILARKQIALLNVLQPEEDYYS